MSEFIDPNVSSTAESTPPAGGRAARAYAASLPAWHPVRQLFSGSSQRLAQNVAVYNFLRLFCEVYDDYIWPPGRCQVVDAQAEFLRLCPDDVLFARRHYRIHRLYANARRSIETAADMPPALRAVVLEAFDRAFYDLVRAIRSNFPSP